MDLVVESQREAVGFYFGLFILEFNTEKKFVKIFQRRVEELETYSKPLQFRCFQTSIWDETLYKVAFFFKLFLLI